LNSLHIFLFCICCLNLYPKKKKKVYKLLLRKYNAAVSIKGEGKMESDTNSHERNKLLAYNISPCIMGVANEAKKGVTYNSYCGDLGSDKHGLDRSVLFLVLYQDYPKPW
jgi:hypothetical protein